MKIKLLQVVILGILILGLVYAGFELKQESIQTEYGPGDFLQGWIQLQLSQQSGNSIITDNFGNSITLKDLAIKNLATNICDNPGCVSKYNAINPATTKTIHMQENETKIIGIKISAPKVTSISSFDINISSNAEKSCINQLEVDFLADGKVDLRNTNASDEICPDTRTYGCFSGQETVQNTYLTSEGYCQKVTLDPAPGFRLGAWIKKEGSASTIDVELKIYNKTSTSTCHITEINNEREYFCNVETKIIAPEEAYLCIKTTSGNKVFYIKGDLSHECAFPGLPPQEEIASYQVFAEKRKYNKMGLMEIPYGMSLRTMAEEYLKKTYGQEITCPDNTCIIPIALHANKEQDVTVNGLELVYITPGFYTPVNEISDLEEIPPKLTTSSTNFYFDQANFKMPTELGAKSLQIKLDDQIILNKQIQIKDVPTVEAISPTITPAGYKTKFIASIKSFGKNITQYEWNFGNGDTLITEKNEVLYRYNETGLKDLTIRITDSDSRTNTKTFVINSSSPKEYIEGEINIKKEAMSKIESDLSSYSEFKKNYLKERINLEDTNSKIAEAQRQEAAANSEEEYIQVMTYLSDIEIPNKIIKSQGAESFEFFIDPEKINLENIEEIIGNSANSEEVREKIVAWNQEKLKTTINFEEISGEYAEGTRKIVNFFDIQTSPKGNSISKYYLIFSGITEANFSEPIQSATSGSKYLEVSSGTKSISFATTNNIDFTDLPLVISPEVVDLSLGVDPNTPQIKKGTSKWLIFGLVIIAVIILSMIIYIALQIWYKKKYENYLFPNKNDLYNLITFVQNAKHSGKNDPQIRQSLRRSKWTGEQVSFVLKKYAGKNTGMKEIKNPFSKKQQQDTRQNRKFPPRRRF